MSSYVAVSTFSECITLGVKMPEYTCVSLLNEMRLERISPCEHIAFYFSSLHYLKPCFKTIIKRLFVRQINSIFPYVVMRVLPKLQQVTIFLDYFFTDFVKSFESENAIIHSISLKKNKIGPIHLCLNLQ